VNLSFVVIGDGFAGSVTVQVLAGSGKHRYMNIDQVAGSAIAAAKTLV